MSEIKEKQIIEITMETEREPGVMKTYWYRPFLNTPVSKQKEMPMFYLTEKGSRDIVLTVKPGNEEIPTQFILNERGPFTKKDTEKAAELIQVEIAKRIASATLVENKH